MCIAQDEDFSQVRWWTHIHFSDCLNATLTVYYIKKIE